MIVGYQAALRYADGEVRSQLLPKRPGKAVFQKLAAAQPSERRLLSARFEALRDKPAAEVDPLIQTARKVWRRILGRTR